MPPFVASIIYLSFVAFLFRRDFREKPNVTRALWLPIIWLFIILSKYVSEWLGLLGLNVGGASLEEGSPVDALFYIILIVAGLRVLARRQVALTEIVRHNRWLTIFFVYCFLAIFWSDFPFVALKRWIKVLGQPIMVLILFTEPDFEVALTVLMKRVAYVIVPISILFIKYYPAYGRGYSEWTGQVAYYGITFGKNALGYDCLILGLFFTWYLLKVLKFPKGKFRRNELILCAGFLFMIGWLLNLAQSSTSLVCLSIGIALMLLLGLKWAKKEYLGTYILLAVAVAAVAEYGFGFSDWALQMLGKDRTLTDRTEVWQDCLDIQINPILGAGFESFWLGDRLKAMWAKWNWHPNQAHNGYLETYLNLGLLGLAILIAVIFATFWKSRRELINNFHLGRFRIAFLCALVPYNWTEATFKAVHPMWFVFYIIALDYPKPAPPAPPETVEEIAEQPIEANVEVVGVEQSKPERWDEKLPVK
jgi:O-antigen ligase